MWVIIATILEEKKPTRTHWMEKKLGSKEENSTFAPAFFHGAKAEVYKSESVYMRNKEVTV
jgi:hypothetical protein